MNNSAIGVFDSGMGGLSVWREIKHALPEESLTYFADGKNCPYGNRPREEVRPFIIDAVDKLVATGVKMIVLACNTATAVAVDYLRDNYRIPFVGMEPAVKPAALSSRSGVIGILATRASLEGNLFKTTSGRYADRVKIISAVGEGFVELVEADEEESEKAYMAVKHAMEPMLQCGADRVVLGCTHYPFLKRQILRVIDDRDVEIIDPAPAIVNRVEYLLDNLDLRAESVHASRYEFMTAADEDYLRRLIDKSRKADCRMEK